MDEHGGRPSPDITFEFGCDRSAPRAARAALNPLLDGDGPLAEDVLLVASELVANVVMHTDNGGRLDAWNEDPLRLEVCDHSPTMPVSRPSGDHLGGRGLHIVDGVADRWGTQPWTDGKLIWAEFRR